MTTQRIRVTSEQRAEDVAAAIGQHLLAAFWRREQGEQVTAFVIEVFNLYRIFSIRFHISPKVERKIDQTIEAHRLRWEMEDIARQAWGDPPVEPLPAHLTDREQAVALGDMVLDAAGGDQDLDTVLWVCKCMAPLARLPRTQVRALASMLRYA